MRTIDTSNVTTTVSAYFKAGTMDHLQWAWQEAINSLAQAQIGPAYDPNKLYILNGCVVTTNSVQGGYTQSMSAGAMFYNGEVFQFAGGYIPATIPLNGNAWMFVIDTAYQTGQSADPVVFSDGASHNIHQIRTVKLMLVSSGTGIAYQGEPIRVASAACPVAAATTNNTTQTVSFAQNTTTITDFSVPLASLTIAYDLTYALPGAKARLVACASTSSIAIQFPASNVILTLLPNTSSSANVTSPLTITLNTNSKAFAVELEYLGKSNTGRYIIAAGVSS